MVLQFRKSILPSLGFLLLAFLGQPLWTVLHGTLTKFPLRMQPRLATPAALVSDSTFKSGPTKQSYGQLPIYFEPNLGQTDSQVKFIARGSGATTFFTATDVVLALPVTGHSRERRSPRRIVSRSENPAALTTLAHQDPIVRAAVGLGRPSRGFGLAEFETSPPSSGFEKPPSEISDRQSAITIRLVGANPNAEIEGVSPLPGISNYFIGNDPKKWRTNIPHYAKVQYREVYPGIDLVYYGSSQQLEYDFVVGPKGDPATIQLAFQGTENLQLDENGDLLIQTAQGEIRQRKPLVYQTREEGRLQIVGRYVIDAKSTVRFELGSYDVSRVLVIDPVMVYSTSIGGNMGEHVSGVAVDNKGNAYVAGATLRTDFPITSGAFQTEIVREPGRAFVAKLNASGDALMYATYLSGSEGDGIQGIAVDSNGQAIVCGIAGSNGFPVTSGAFQTQLRGTTDAFVTKLNGLGSALLYSSYLGGSGADGALELALDSLANAHLVGFTDSLDFPVTPGAFRTTSTSSGSGDRFAFVTKLNANGTSQVSSTYLARVTWDPLDIALDGFDRAYVTGTTSSQDFPTSANAFQKTLRGSQDAFVLRLNSTGTALDYSTFLGSATLDSAAAIAIDHDGSAYITGSTNGSDFPTTPGAQDTVYHGYLKIPIGEAEPFVTKLSPTGTALTYSTFLNGTRSLGGNDIAVDFAGNACIVSGGFVSKLNSTGAILRFSQSAAPTADDEFAAVTVDSAGNIYAAGRTYLRPPAGRVQPLDSGIFPALVVKLSASDSIPQFIPIILSAAGLNGSFYTSELTLTNRSASDAILQFSYTAAFGEGSGLASDQLPAGHQRIVPDALAYLRSIGIPIPSSGNRGGTLRIDTPAGVFASARTTNATAGGRAGLSYASFPTMQGFTEISYLYGLRQNERDRSNLAIQNLGGTTEGEITLRLTVFPGDPNSPARGLYEERLAPGEFRQITGILADRGVSFAQGFVSVERTGGTAPYFAYAVVNDQATSDGSFIPPILSHVMNGRSGFTIPAMVETSQFSSELILANSSGVKRTLQLAFRADAIQTADQTARLTLDLDPLQQLIVPDFVQFLRSRGVQGVEDANTSYAGPLFITAQAIDLRRMFVGARTSTRGAGGRYGVFYPGVPQGTASTKSAWLHGLRQDSENRTNLAIVNTGELDATDSEFEIEIYDGATGQKTATGANVVVPAKSWRQIGNILANYAPGVSQGYARVIKVSGSNRFITYAVINDGASPGERTGDGAFIGSSL